jgi:dipeptidyl aminopeptidase/acylaminoacyl peptidase
MTTPLQRLARVATIALAGLLVSATPSAAQYFGQNKVQYDEFDFEVLETDHFDIYYYPVEAEAARLTAQMAERWYARLSTLLSHELSSRQPVVLYASHPEFEQTNVIEGLISEATGGVTEGGRRRVVLPLAASLGETDHVLGHELVHAFQYDILGDNIGRAPLWFIEGMAEYLSIGPRHPQTAMWLRDAALEGALPDLQDLYSPNYFPYRFGHGLWAFVGGRFGDDAVASALHRVGSVQGGMDAIDAIELTTKMEHEELAAAWHASIHELYGITPRDGEQAEAAARELPRALLAARSGSGSMNVGPSLSPNGERIAFLSERSRLSIELYVADTKTGEHVRRLTSTAVDPHFESLQFLGSSGTWAPDNRRLAVASVQRGRGAIAIFDADDGRLLENIRLESRGEIFQPAWSPDGQSIAFVAQVGGFTDLYIYDLGTRQTRRLTNDPFADLQPAWSPDGRHLLFVTDRHSSSLDTLAFGSVGLATIEVDGGRITPVRTGLQGQASSPQWTPDGLAIEFVSDHSGRPDVYRVGLTSGQASPRTALPTGVSGITPISPALSVARTTGLTAFTVFRNGEYEIRLLEPDARGEVPTADLARLPPVERASNLVAQQLEREEPVPASETFDTRPYSSGLTLVGIGQSLGASTGGPFGTSVSGGISMLFSDILGNHLVPVTFGVEGGVKDIAAQTGYINRTRRWNWGVIASHVPLRSGYVDAGYTFTDDGYPLYVENVDLLRETTTELGGLVAYPLSRATRVEFNASVQRIGFSRERETFIYDGLSGDFLQREKEDLGGLPSLKLARTGAALVRDSTAFGAVSPVLGQRFRFEVSPTFGDLNMTTASLDFRQYVMPFRPLTLAARGLHVGRYGTGGEDSRLYPLFLGYPSLVRGYDSGSFDASECTITSDGSCPEFDRLIGSRVLVFNGEARVPLFGLFSGNFDYGPIPAEVFGFFDAGVAWTRAERPSFADGSRPWVTSAGFGARVNLFGFAIGEFNAARALDRPGKGWQFVFNLRPGF